MATSYTSLLGLALPVTGELSGTWGDTVNNYITNYLDAAVAGVQIISGSQTAVTLSVTNGSSLVQVGAGATGSAQYGIIRCSGNPASLLTITAPAASKSYLIINATSTSQSVKIVGTGPTTGVTLVSGESAVVAWNGTDFIKVSSSAVDGVSTFSAGTTGFTPSSATSGAVTLAGTLGIANGGTGITSFGTGVQTALGQNVTGSGGIVLATSPTLVTPALGTPSSGVVTNLTGTASININGTVGATTPSTVAATTLTTSSTVTHNGGTANGVAYLNGSKVLTTGSALTFDGTRLGVGTASPGAKLTVSDASTGALIRVSSDTNGSNRGFEWHNSPTANIFGSIVSNYTNGILTYDSGGSVYAGSQAWSLGTGGEQMRLTSTGLGIGTSSPGQKLDVNGDARVGNATAGTNRVLQINGVVNKASRIAFQESGTDRWLIGNGAASENGNFEIYDATNGNNFVLTRTGNLGLGVTPSAWGSSGSLDGKNDFTWSSYDGSIGSNYYYNGSYKYKSSGVAVSKYAPYNGTHIWFTAPSGTAGNAISFTQAMTLDASGNLGIGTSSPGQKLEVVGTGKFNSMEIGANNSDINNANANAIAFKIQGTERMRIDTSGNLGLGVTPPASGARALYIAGAVGGYTALALGASGGDYGRIGYGFSVTGSSSVYNYMVNDTASAIGFSLGGFQFFTAPSGTAGNAITFTQAMTLDANGDFLIGTTSAPANGANARNVVFNNPNSVPTYVKISNGATGATASDGFDLIMGTSSDAYVYNRENGPMIFGTNATERARITSGGNLLVGTTSFSFSSNGVQIGADGRIWNTSNIDYNFELAGSTGNRIRFYTSAGGSGATVGSITVSTTATAYNTSSDYRLKDNAQPLTGSGAFIDALQPKTWDWKADGSKGVGFIAHEVQAVSPGSVVGTKDAVDAEGNPVMQAMEYGSAEFIANIVAELQSLRARVAQLESKGA